VELKIVVLGAGGVGKTCVTIRFVRGLFVDRYDPTIEDSFRKLVEVDQEQYNLTILDTAGSDHFSAIRDLYMRDGQGFIIIYSIDSISSFKGVRSIIDNVIAVKGCVDEQPTKVPVIIGGNKCDLMESKRTVPREEGQNLADEYDILFLETSAKEMINVQEMFFYLVREIEKGRPKKEKKERRSRKRPK